ncbi:hypothetical protein BsWGS_18909 [Bradybaena similaris]
MSTFACLLLCALLGAVCNSLVKTESSPEPQYSPCYFNGTWYDHGASIPDPCNFCFCSNGNKACTLMACFDTEGNPFPIPQN